MYRLFLLAVINNEGSFSLCISGLTYEPTEILLHCMHRHGVMQLDLGTYIVLNIVCVN